MSHFGLDIGASLIKIAQIDNQDGVYKLVKAGMAENPTGSLQLNSDMEINSLAETIKKLISDVGLNTREAAFAVPESQIYSSIIEMPLMSDDQLEQAINWEAENVIPKPLNEVSFSWKVIESGQDSAKKDTLKVLLVAAPLKLIDKYLKVANLSGVDFRLIETESIAIGRVLALTNPADTHLAMIQIGHDTTNIGIYLGGELMLSQTMKIAGGAMTRGVATNLSLDQQESEEYKKAYGLSVQLEGKIATSLTPILDNIALEVKKTIGNFEQKNQKQIKLVVLAGGSVLMPGIAEYFTSKIGVEVQLLDPSGFIQIDPTIQPVIKTHAPLFIVAFGLALNKL